MKAPPLPPPTLIGGFWAPFRGVPGAANVGSFCCGPPGDVQKEIDDCRENPACKWEFPKIRGTLFGGPYNKDPTI